MIKEKELKILITRRNKKYYINKGYDCKEINKEIKVSLEDVNPSSRIKITAICEICDEEKIISLNKYTENVKRGGYYGCKKCSRLKFKETNLKLYGVDNPMKVKEIQEKVEKTNMERYNVKTTLLDPITKEKIRKTIKDKYDVDEILSNKEIREKGKMTLLSKYGVDHFSKTNDFYNLTYKRWENDAISKLEKYNIKDYKLTEERMIKIKCKTCNNYYEISSKLLYGRFNEYKKLCTICNPIDSHISGKELELFDFIKEHYNDEIIKNDKKILNGKELDIYLPNINLAFEFNGVYWHSELYKDKNYHINKSDNCEKQGIHLIHIYEDDWIYKNNIIKSMILNKLGKIKNKIYGRKTEIKKLDNNKLIRDFLNKNHLQGFVGAKVKIGLFYDNELVSLMTFGKKRLIMKSKSKTDDEYELLRFCNKLNTNVIGGASKLFKYFIRNFNPKEISTFADRSHSVGNLYEKLGFEYIHKTQPNYYYVIRKKREYRFNFRKDILVKQGYDKNMTEHEIMLSRNIYRIYDSGQLKYVWLS